MGRSRFRSVTYDLETSLALARQVAELHPATPEALAVALSYSGVRNGAFLQRLANARLFGLVAGNAAELHLTDRGRRCLSTDAAEASRAKTEACLAVPLFRQVLERYSGSRLPHPEELSRVLQEEFGETASKARVVANRLLDSLGQAGLLRAGSPINRPGEGWFTDFTATSIHRGQDVVPPVAWRLRARFLSPSRQGGRRKGGRTVPDRNTAEDQGSEVEAGGLWLDGPEAQTGSHSRWRRLGVVAAAVACLAVVGVPVSILLTGSGPGQRTQSAQHSRATFGSAAAEHSVLQALSATTDSGSFDFSYQLSVVNGSSSSTTGCPGQNSGAPTTTACPAVASNSGGVVGSGVIDTNPMAMAASAAIDPPNGLQVGVRVDPTNVWEVAYTDNGLTPQQPTYTSTNGSAQVDSGQPLPDFASLTEGTLGQRQGAVAMMGMASPTGYLDLVQPAISGAAAAGTSTVSGVPVTQYELTIDPSQLATAPGVTPQEATTITDALGVLNAQGATTFKATVSIDGSGFIRESSSTVSFSDGGSVTLTALFSNFGCAGTVLMPDQTGTSTAPAGCSTSDTGVAPATSVAPTTTAVTTPPTPTTTPTTSGNPGSSTTMTTIGNTSTTTTGATG